MAPPRPPPELVDDAVAEILLRLPPDEPACLVRASLVCKRWRRFFADPAFPRRYREFHRTPPLLGFLHNSHRGRHNLPRFVPTTALPCPKPEFDYLDWWAMDCRHGRVLLHEYYKNSLLVWDPIIGRRRRLRDPRFPHSPFDYSAVVLCAIDGCNHLDCHDGPFHIVFVDVNEFIGLTRAWVYSSEAATWSKPTSVQLCKGNDDSHLGRGVLIGDQIYFMLQSNVRILKYDLGNHCLSVINSQDLGLYSDSGIVLMPIADGSLGIISVKDSSLCLWSRIVNLNGVAEWVRFRAIELQELIPIDILGNGPEVVGFAEGAGIVFVRTDFAAFTIELKSGRARKVGKSEDFFDVLPFMSFYTPGMVVAFY
ncbi:unnamed protein product [Urochloa decumbens]|uniref:F-box domain-containing protein n=1 Tax=Urochloa decumbens TaxID=240449 RepID=A0ABC9GCX9_9POAL